jgi:hypothetical protein
MACKHWQGDARDAPPGAFSSDGLVPVVSCVLCVVIEWRMAKKPLGVVRGIKKVMAFPSKKNWSRLTPPKGAPTPLLSTPGAPECHMQYRKGPNAVRTGHTATSASLDLRKAGAKTQDLGRGWSQLGGGHSGDAFWRDLGGKRPRRWCTNRA